MTDRGLSLYEIQSELAEMVQAREEAVETLAMAPTEADRAACQAEVDRCDEAIRAYLEAEIRKVDGIVAFLANEQAMEEAAGAEAERLKRRSLAHGMRVERLKALVLEIMQARGLKKLEGNLGTLAVQANGGVQALEINEALLPDEYCEYRLKLPHDVLRKLLPIIKRMLGSEPSVWREPKQGLIRGALGEACPGCGGSGFLTSEEERRELATASGNEFRCELCGGDGKTHIPGAQLLPRGSHLRIR